MPQVDFYDEWGRFTASVTVTSISTDGQGTAWLTGAMPSLVYNGTYIVAVNEVQSDSTLDIVGTMTLGVTNGQDPPIYEPPPPPDPTPDPDGCVRDCLVY